MALEFKDRVPQKPGRVKITPENGTAFYATMERADEPIQEGTPLSAGNFNQMVAMIQNTYTKAETLSDATKAVYGLGTSAVPEDVFAFLGEYAKYCWKRKTEDFVFSVGKTTNLYVLHEGSTTKTRTIYYGDSVAYAGDGKIVIENEQSGDFSYSTKNDLSAAVKGKYIRNAYQSPETIYFVPEPISTVSDSPRFSIYLSPVSGSFEYGENWEIVSNTDPNAYPIGSTDIEHGYYYEPLGRPFDNAVVASKVVTGSYTGLGVYNSSHKNKLTFDFTPKLVMVYKERIAPTSGSDEYQLFLAGGTKAAAASNSNNIYTLENGKLEWYSDYGSSSAENASGVAAQMNKAGTTYYYLAIA